MAISLSNEYKREQLPFTLIFVSKRGFAAINYSNGEI